MIDQKRLDLLRKRPDIDSSFIDRYIAKQKEIEMAKQKKKKVAKKVSKKSVKKLKKVTKKKKK